MQKVGDNNFIQQIQEKIKTKNSQEEEKPTKSLYEIIDDVQKNHIELYKQQQKLEAEKQTNLTAHTPTAVKQEAQPQKETTKQPLSSHITKAINDIAKGVGKINNINSSIISNSINRSSGY